MAKQTTGTNGRSTSRKMVLWTIGCALFTGLPLSCTENNVVVEPTSTGQNQPTTVSTLNTLTFSVDAIAFSFQSSSDLTFTGDSLVYVLSITGYAQGGGFLKVLNASGSTILSDSLNSNRAIVNTNMAGRIPARFAISLTNFTGKISIVLTTLGSSGMFRIEDFPNTIGSQWTYAVFDSLTHQPDTLVATIVGQTVLANNMAATVWRMAYSNLTDSQYVELANDTMTVYYRRERTLFVFPFQVGSMWIGSFLRDSNSVVHRGQITVPAGSFASGFQIREKWSFPQDSGEAVTWMVPRVGIVDLRRKQYGFQNLTWRLIGYTIVP
jgi:hypothetical protein